MPPDRSTRPAAQKRLKAAAPLDAAERALRRILSTEEHLSSPTEEIPLVPITGTGVERPVPEWVEISQSLYRVFAFVDVCAFTSFTDRHGTHAAIEVLTRFRSAARDVTGRRGVRVIKWLGDGVMLVGVEPGPVIAAVCELALRFGGDDINIHPGIAGGHVLLFEGDDYVGPAANHASRLCEVAEPGEILAMGVRQHLPDWVSISGERSIQAQGVGQLHGVVRLSAQDEVIRRAEPPADRPAGEPFTAARWG